jgi:hypothetical protein
LLWFVNSLEREMKHLIERLRQATPEWLPQALASEAADALLAQQAVIEQMREAFKALQGNSCGDYADEIIAEALALQPSLDALREHDAEVVEKFGAYNDLLGGMADAELYAERVRKGEA